MFLKNIIIYSKLKKIYLFLLWTSYGEKKKDLVTNEERKKTKKVNHQHFAQLKKFFLVPTYLST